MPVSGREGPGVCVGGGGGEEQTKFLHLLDTNGGIWSGPYRSRPPYFSDFVEWTIMRLKLPSINNTIPLYPDTGHPGTLVR